MNAYNAVCDTEGLGRWNVLVSYCTPVLASDGDTLIALTYATCSATTRKHVGTWLKRFSPCYTYQDVKHVLSMHDSFDVDVTNERALSDDTVRWLYELRPLSPCKSFNDGIYQIERGVGPWSRVTC